MKCINRRIAGVVAATFCLAACVTPPMAPTIPVAPGPNKPYQAFYSDQMACQQFAYAQTAPEAAAATNQAVGTALLTTALGAGLGAAAGSGSWHGNAGRGAGIGAASGAVVGTALGAGQAGFAQMSLQQQYDVLYAECMSAHGNPVPGLSQPPGPPPYSGAPGPASYRPPPYPGGPGPSPYGSSPYSGGPGPSPYGSPPYPGGPG